MTVVASTQDESRRHADRALWLVWTALTLFLAGVGIGFGWDRAWHATRPFEDFWSPPHLFTYSTIGLAGFAVWCLVLADGPRASLRPSLGTSATAARLPGPLVLAAGGLAAVALAGLLDSIWHTRFGLDETGWSLPHALLGWGTLLTFLGLVSCRLALRNSKPLGRVTPLLLALLGLLWTVGVLLGPYNGNRTAETVERVAQLPALAREPAVQHTARIYLRWHIVRTGPLFLPLSALAAGVGLGLASELVRRARTLLLVSLLATFLTFGQRRAEYLGLADDPRVWLPLPYVFAGLGFLGARFVRLGVTAAWCAAGLVWGGYVALVWGQHVVLVSLAVLVLPAGAWLGGRVARVVRAPTARGVAWLLGVTAAVPAITGCIDLALRWQTP